MDDLLNWVWQGCLVALAAQAAVSIFAAGAPRARLVVWWTALLLVAALPLAPLVAGVSRLSEAAALPTMVPIAVEPGYRSYVATALLAIWCTWALVHAVRVALALRLLARAKAAAAPIPFALERRLRIWTSLKSRGRIATLRLSNDVHAAAVLGGPAPVVAVAPALFSELTPDELDPILVHEWAHVQRRDDVGNLVQVLVGVVAGWHPAVRWIDRQLRLERESACDEVAVSLVGTAKGYAGCLARLAGLPLAPRAPLPIPGALSRSGLRVRIDRILRMDTAPARRWSTSTVAALMVVALAAAAASGWEIAGAGPAESFAEARAETPPAALTQRELAPVPARTLVLTGSPQRSRDQSPSGRPPVTHAAAAAVPGPRVEPAGTVTPDPHRPIVTAAPLAPIPSRVASSVVVSVPLDLFPPSDPSRTAVTPDSRSPWNAAADAGIAVGRTSQAAALSTASFFTRFGRRIAGSF